MPTPTPADDPVDARRPTGLRVLFLGGTGVISAAAAVGAVAVGHEVTLLNRGRTSLRETPAGAETVTADVRDPAAVRAVLGDRRFDVVVDAIAFTAEHAAAAVDLFTGRTGQYVFVSSASAYQKPPERLPILESTPLRNPFWDYSRDKIAAEDLLVRAYREQGFPVTIVRPSSTYDRTRILLDGGATDLARMRAGRPVVVHGDGTSLWTVTHSSDLAKALVGLFGLPQAVGDSFTVTSDEVLPWDRIYRMYAAAAGAPEPDLVHVASETIAATVPALEGSLLGDRSHSVIFDNTKVKTFVPGFVCTTPFATGVREAVRWHDEHPEHHRVDDELDAAFDRLVAAARPH